MAALRRTDGALLWRRDGSGDIVVTQGVVVVHESEGSYPEAKVLDLATGRQRFDVAFGDGMRSESVSVADEVLMVQRCSLDSHCSVAALDLRNGRQRWSRQADQWGTALPHMPWTDGPRDDDGPIGVPTTLTNRIAVFVATSGDGIHRRTTAATVDVRNGEVLTRRRVTGSFRNLRLVGDRLIADSGCSEVRVLDARSLRKVWTRPICVDDVVRVGDLLVDSHASGLIDLETGDLTWMAPSGSTWLGVDSERIVSYAYGEYSGDRKAAGMVVAVDRSSGRQAWRVRSPGDEHAHIDSELERYGLAGGRVVFDRREWQFRGSPRVLRVMRASDGRSLWHARDTGLVGIGDGWIVGTGWTEWSGPASPAEVRYFAA
ncbi:MAG: PQQ-binding-like beta-propeller repeat protein [Micromonosporaceae bacterium]